MKKALILLATTLAVGFISSCAGAPETPETPPPITEAISGRPEAEAARQSADAARAKADAEKASMVAKEEYQAALEAYKKADSEFSSERYSEAATAYKLAEDGFIKSEKLAAQRKAAALEAMQSADASLKTTDDRFKAIEEEIGSEGDTP